MKKYILLLSFSWAINFVWAQRENDGLYFGGCDVQISCACNTPLQGHIYKFNDDSLEEIIDPACLPMNTFYSSATFCDKNTGELIFASNGWRLVNGDEQIVSHKLWFSNIPHPGGPDSTSVNNNAGPLFLPHPGDSTKAYLFYGQLWNYAVQSSNYRMDKYFTYALLDIPTKTLISKNNIILSDTSSRSDMQACRHANGRDWWIIKPDIWSNKYFIGLLTPQGIEMNNITLQGVPSDLRVNTSSKFNIQGTKYIHYNGGLSRVVHEFDFDRCTGTLSNFVLHDISDSISWIDGSLASMTISPDGSKFYIQRNSTFLLDGLEQGFFQVDLATNSMNLIVRYGGSPQMAPNGKTIIFRGDSLIGNNQWLTRISEISNPNESFQNLDIHHYKYTHPNANLGIAPSNFAYMRLGADTLSICDSLSVITKRNGKQNQNSLVVFPNPASNYLKIEQQEQGITQYRIINHLGQVVQFWQSSEITQNIALSNMSTGFYLLQATSSMGRVVQKKFVVQH